MGTKAKTAKPKPDKIAVGYIHGLDVSAAFCNSLLALALHESNRDCVSHFIPIYSGVNVSSGRNRMVREFLDSDSTWLLMIDADMMFAPDSLERLVPYLDEESVPILGGLCFGVTDGTLFPTLYMLGEEDGKHRMLRFNQFPDDTLFGPSNGVPLHGTGAAFLIVHRKVFRKIEAEGYNKAFPWFQETELSDEPMGEDLTFCLRANALGFPVHVHTGVVIGHQKQQILDLAGFRSQQGS